MLRSYETDGFALKYCKAVFLLNEYRLSHVRAIIPSGAMLPDDDMTIYSFDDIHTLQSEGREVSMCIFIGMFRGEELRLCIDIEADLITFDAVDEKIISSFREALSLYILQLL